MGIRIGAGALLLCLFGGQVHAEPPQVGVTTQGGHRAIVGMSDFDNKHLSFKLRSGKEKQELALSQVARLEFAPFDTVERALIEDTLDVFLFRDGNKLKGVFRDLDDDEVFALMGAARSEQRYKLSTLVSIDLSQTPFDVDRRIWGKGGIEFVNDAIESLISAQAVTATEAQLPLLEDKQVSSYLDSLGQMLAAGSKRPGLPYEFKVVNQKVVNAFTVGGGKVYVYRGLIEHMANEAELAGVLAHEIGHNVGRHTIRSLYKQMLLGGLISSAGELAYAGKQPAGGEKDKMVELVTNLLVSKYGRDDEREADYLGTYNLYQRGYDPHAMVGVFETLKQFEAKNPELLESFLASHPSADERIEDVSAELDRLGANRQLVSDTPAFEAMKQHLQTLPRPIAKIPVMSDTIDVEGLGRSGFSFVLKDTSEVKPILKGTFRAYGGGGNDIRVLVMSETDYLNFINGHKASALYDSGPLTTATIAVPLPSLGKFYLVFDNSFSLLTPKTVDVQFYQEYEQ